ncbi:MAG: hypothetical protein KJ950_17495 [Proteobacteria bacterium]|nr:hypothetical protein [Pseudomonadota bacterium]MBU1689055.1 hypothetical protein [Pseudomonadota bacterium]
MMVGLPLIGGLLGGIIAGLYYFYGLLLTVRRVPLSPQPKRLLFMSYLGRLVPVVLVMMFLARRDPGGFVAFILGFFLARMVLTRKIARQRG